MNDIVFVGKHKLTNFVSKHFHKEWEIIYCTSGKGKLVFASEELSYHEGDIVVIPLNLPHTNSSVEGFTNIFMNIDNCTLRDAEPFLISNSSTCNILGVFQSAFSFYSTEDCLKPGLMSSIGNLVVEYISLYHKENQIRELSKQINRHIIENYVDCRFDLGEYLHSLPYSYDYIIKMFKDDFGESPHKYLTSMRLRLAAKSLSTNTSSSMAEIALLSGFSDPLYFSRLFKKKYGISPSQYSAGLTESSLKSVESVKIYSSD